MLCEIFCSWKSHLFGYDNTQRPFYQTKAAVLEEMGKTSEANAAMKDAIAVALMQELHNYARQLT